MLHIVHIYSIPCISLSQYLFIIGDSEGRLERHEVEPSPATVSLWISTTDMRLLCRRYDKFKFKFESAVATIVARASLGASIHEFNCLDTDL